ncbi:MAG: hypothetical protein COB02_01280 [Candidatus Cloacimonadota bacterium]|nr:MAG: hypothetical protein COB02_01280 [Candidatus Cloacimonadota bacterium]
MYKCLVCAWTGLEENPIKDLFSFEVCGCCGCQYGYDIKNLRDVITYREGWLLNSAPWFDNEINLEKQENNRPEKWSIEKAKARIKDHLSSMKFKINDKKDIY